MASGGSLRKKSVWEGRRNNHRQWAEEDGDKNAHPDLRGPRFDLEVYRAQLVFEPRHEPQPG